MKYIPFISTPAIALVAIVAAAFSIPSQANAQNGTPAREAFNAVTVQFGPQAVQWIAEMRGINGIPQPTEWHILAYDPQAPQLLHRYWSAEGRSGDNGPDLERYPVNVPVGYFRIDQVVVDSVAAFTIAEGEARKAKMGFDSCSFLLRVREYSSEPIWRMELIDVNRQIVGKVYISGQNGEVLRTVWIDRERGGKVLDSSAPGNQLAPAVTTGPGLSNTDPLTTNPTGIASNTTPPMSTTSRPPTTSTQPLAPTTTTPPSSGTRITPIPPRKNPVITTTTPPPAPTTNAPIRDMREVPTRPVVTKKPEPKPQPKPAPKPSKPIPKPSGGRIPPPPIPGS